MSGSTEAFADRFCNIVSTPSQFCFAGPDGNLQVGTADLAAEADVYIVVFGAYWCPPARNFFNILKDAIEVMRDGRKITPTIQVAPVEPIESKPAARSKRTAAVAQREREREEAERAAALAAEEALDLPRRRVAAVLVAHDSDAAAHARAAGAFPGFTIPFGDPRAAELFKLRAPPGIPFAMVVDAVRGVVARDDAVEQIRTDVETGYRTLFESWVGIQETPVSPTEP